MCGQRFGPAHRANHTAACSCARPPDPLTALERSDAVFAGKVLQVNKHTNWRNWIPFWTSPGIWGYDVMFEVQTAWKGVDQTQVLIVTDGVGGGCGIAFQPGDDYLVYASYWEGSDLASNICTRTTLLANAAEDMQVLGAGAAPTSPAASVWTRQLGVYGWIAAIAAAGALLMFYVSSQKRRR